MRTLTRAGFRHVKNRIKAVHTGTAAFTAADASKVVTIPAVVRQNALIFLLGMSVGGLNGAGDNAFFRPDITSETQVTVTRGGSGETDVCTVGVLVVEYWPGVLRTLQRGTIVLSGTATVPSTEMSKAILSLSGWSFNSSAFDAFYFPRLSVNSPTQIGATSGDVGATAGYQFWSE